MNNPARAVIRSAYLPDEAETVRRLAGETGLDEAARWRIVSTASDFVKDLRSGGQVGLMETFLAEYGLSSMEGVALMCLAEALLRVPDDITIDDLIRDKIAPADWARHMGGSDSLLVNASTWALMLTGKVIGTGDGSAWDVRENLLSLVRRAGEPMIRTAVTQSMKVLGHQFVLGRDISEAMARAQGMIDKGYTYSYDMLGEAARSAADASRYFMSYSQAITAIAGQCKSDNVFENSGISVKLSALHPRYEFTHKDRVLDELVPRVSSLALIAKNAGMGFNIDAEEADRLELSLDVIEQVLTSPDLKGWDGFGVVVQAYMPRAPFVIDWLYELAKRLDRRIMVRLVKGAYWDSEIKIAQVEGYTGYPVFTRKASTDICYLACARRLLAMTDRIYPQFATHNAHTLAAVLELSAGTGPFEFQRLHGMGEALHDNVKQQSNSRCRIYAPVGNHRDLLAYLVRRLLENGANSSFVNQVLDPAIEPRQVVRDPLAVMQDWDVVPNPGIPLPGDLFGGDRVNSAGVNLADPLVRSGIDGKRESFRRVQWAAGDAGDGEPTVIVNPANPDDIVGTAHFATVARVELALSQARVAVVDWQNQPSAERAACLTRYADLLESNAPEFYALCCREAGKTLVDAIGEVREAVDFCRYYAQQEINTPAGEGTGRGVFVCISPWNFPLAIFTGQVVAALVTGNAVIAKPAEQTPLIAARAVALMHEAGIPEDVLHLLPGDGVTVGAALVSDPRVDGVCFTGSTETAMAINRAMAAAGNPRAPLIAETGGLNAMIVDSTALLEQAVDDIMASAFQSAGQRCSALRVLFVQEDVAEPLIQMLDGALQELDIGDPWELSCDVGPVIDDAARDQIIDHCRQMESEGRLIARRDVPDHLSSGTFVAPAIYALQSLDQLTREIFGPVLHVIRFPSGGVDQVVDQINNSGYGLTLGLHTRLDHRVHDVANRARVGNCYINRNQIGAVVGVQPFGGEGLSGTGPKAGGPLYLKRFVSDNPEISSTIPASPCDQQDLVQALARAANVIKPEADIDSEALPGPTGETNILSRHPRGVVLCLGCPDLASRALAAGNGVVLCGGDQKTGESLVGPGHWVAGIPGPETLTALTGFDVVAARGSDQDIRAIRQALAARPGVIIPLMTEAADAVVLHTERTLSINTTASGGNAALLASAGDDL